MGAVVEPENVTRATEKPKNDLMTIEEVEQEYPWSAATLRDWRYRKIGPPSARIGRRVFYRRSELEKYVAEQFRSQR